MQHDRFAWLTPLRCRCILVALLALGFGLHLVYLHWNCPIDLSGDEAQYWDWSRQLDLSYYSKGPLVAYVIRASCAMFGETMQAVRYPALLLGLLTSIVTYALTTKLFGSERLALGAVLLYSLCPLFLAGSVLMTIDPPFYLCWACATYFAAVAVFDRRPGAWVAVGIFCGIGFLAKYAMLLWFLGLLVFIARARQRHLAGAIVAFVIACLFTTPVIIWNARHGWVSLRHVAHQTGTSGGQFDLMGLVEHLGAQLGLLQLVSVFMIGAVVFALRQDATNPTREKIRFLLWIGATFFLLTTAISVVTKIQANWPAPAYFTLIILTAYFISTRMESSWNRWRGWFFAMVIAGVICAPIAHDMSLVFPILKKFAKDPGKVDPTTRLRGWAMLGMHISNHLEQMSGSPFVLCDDYMQTAAMAFYVRGQPKTYYAGSYFLSDPKRLTQYDMWEDRRLDDYPGSELIGENAIYVGKGGKLPPELAGAFDRVEKLPELPVIVRGVTVKTFKLWKCFGFHGMKRPAENTY